MAATSLSEPVMRHPITGIAFCCARAASGHVAAAPPRSVMNPRRCMSHPGNTSRPAAKPSTLRIDRERRNGTQPALETVIRPDVSVGSNSEKLYASICFPLFIQ